jgi:tetratricopeptide (TPR) repeat protein
VLLDRVEDRLVDAPEGLHHLGEPADAETLAAAGLPDDAAMLWERWDGIELGNGEARMLPLAEHARASAEAREQGLLHEGDRVIGEHGSALLVLPADPWAEGGDVVSVEDDGQRAPLASSLLALTLGLVAEMALLYDEEGEYHDELFASNGELRPKAERKLLRRRLDFDEDAPLPRYRLAQLLRRAGEARGARSELERVLVCAPQFAWAHFELGRALLDLDSANEAARSFAAAAEQAEDRGLRAHFLAWQARASEGEARLALAAKVLELDPTFVNAQEAGLREAIDHDDPHAHDLLALGLAVAPTHLGLLALRPAVEAVPITQRDEGPDEFDLPDEVDRELAREREHERAQEASSSAPAPASAAKKKSSRAAPEKKPSPASKRWRAGKGKR